jgi:PhnB protein
MAKHTTYIFSEDARTQAGFYTKALGGEILSVVKRGEVMDKEEDKDKVMHLSFVAAGVNFFMSDHSSSCTISITLRAAHSLAP